MKWGVPEWVFCCWAPLAASNTSKVASGEGGPNVSKIVQKNTFLADLGVLLAQTFGENWSQTKLLHFWAPPPFRPEIRRRLPLGFSWAALGLLLAAPGLLLAAPGLLLGGSWLLLGGPRLLLGCSWAAPGLVLGCSWAAPGCSWPAPGGSQAAPGLLPAALGLLLGFSWLLLDCSWLLLAACGCSWAAPGLLSQKHEQPATTNNLRQFGLLRWGVRVVVSTRRSERWVRLHTIASISSRDLVLGVSAERGVPEAVRASIAKLNINITWNNNYKTMKLEETKSIYIYISMHLYINIAIYIYLSLYISISIYLSIYISLYLYIHVSIYLYICRSTHL